MPRKAAEPEPAKPKKPAPFVEIDIEISLPAPGNGRVEAAPFMEDTLPNVNMDELWKELRNPHSGLRLRIKDKLQKHIIAQTISPALPAPEPKHFADPDPPKSHTVPRTLGLRDMPKDTGGAYMMKGFTPAEAPFAGGHKYNFTGTVEVTSKGMGLPAPYQPYRDDNEQPYGREKPNVEFPAGQRRLPPEHVAPRSLPGAEKPAPEKIPRVFSLVRVGPRPSSGPSSEMYALPP
eukprot:TRINITY_DN9524_c0_g1_i1.p1 TRINITY_DN9524_c0_g1~~TRINITY_DN9524_c0_g1_i1.p1  ORF type:complete len:234 (+),score=39.91 TRINITY_DN9524_c0_g1_i1:81-782(+)